MNQVLSIRANLSYPKSDYRPVPIYTMTEEQGRILGIISIVLSVLALTYTALWFTGIV
jgi:hypothetical protein